MLETITRLRAELATLKAKNARNIRRGKALKGQVEKLEKENRELRIRLEEARRRPLDPTAQRLREISDLFGRRR